MGDYQDLCLGKDVLWLGDAFINTCFEYYELDPYFSSKT